MSLKQKIIGIIVLLGGFLIFIFQQGLYSKPTDNTPMQSDEIKIVSTNPNPLEGATILPIQKIEITFNRPIEGSGEFKTTMDPQLDYKIELSEDRKTAIITPNKPYTLGGGYTLHIMGNTKFDGKKQLDREEIFHFKTINYSGV